MSKEDSIEVTGTVVEKFPSGQFSVLLDQDRTVLAHLAGKLRRNQAEAVRRHIATCLRCSRRLGRRAVRRTPAK